MIVLATSGFEQWRDQARNLLLRQVPPSELIWQDGERGDSVFAGLTDGNPTGKSSAIDRAPAVRVPQAFLALAEKVACHRNGGRWTLLYRLLWRLTHGERHLLEIQTDDDVFAARQMEKQVRRDAHKMKAFVRFRRCVRDGEEWFVAWHRPDHRIVKLVAPFFAERFSSMRWLIMTPHESASWDMSHLRFHAGDGRDAAPAADELEQMWLTYYAAIFNPARIKLGAMRAEMPIRHWPTLPETRIIGQLLSESSARVREMEQRQANWALSARDVLPPRRDLGSLELAAKQCQACPLHVEATQTVFGEGPAHAKLVLVGEQPGDEEDVAGRPFVGPAGRLLDDILAEVGIQRSEIYVTNAVKHFSHVQRGKRRLHKKPRRIEVVSCRAWLESELAAIQPQVLVCLGATAAASVLGPAFKLTAERGRVLPSQLCPTTLATYHPAAILRAHDPTAASQKRASLRRDLRDAARLMQQRSL